MKYKIIIPLCLLISLYSCMDNSIFGGSNTAIIYRAIAPKSKCIPSALQDHLLSFYSFSSFILFDGSGFNHNLYNYNSVYNCPDRFGNPTCAAYFHNGNYLYTPNANFLDDFDRKPFSISVWVKTANPYNFATFQTIISRDNFPHCPDGVGQWSFGLYDCKQPVVSINAYALWHTTPAGPSDCNYNIANEWNHYVITSQGQNNMKIYKNGQLTNNTNLADGAHGGCTPIPTTTNKGSLYIGKDFDGYLDDLFIYDKILSTKDIDALYNLLPCCDDLITVKTTTQNNNYY